MTPPPIIVSDSEILRTVVQEAGRQAAFYERRGARAAAAFWGDLENLAFEAKQTGHGLRILMEGKLALPIPIKPCGPCEQPGEHPHTQRINP